VIFTVLCLLRASVVRSAEQEKKLFISHSVTTAHAQLCPTMQREQIVPVRETLTLFNSRKIHDGLSMNSSKHLRIETMLNVFDG